MREFKLPRDGGCLCGRVRFRVTAPPLLSMACHCRGCQRLTAGPYSLSILVPRAGFALLEGEPVAGALHGETPYLFCPWCLSWLYTEPVRLPGMVSVRAPLLDDTDGLEPYIETQTAEKLPWAQTPAQESFERWPSPEAFPRIVAAYAEG